MFEYWGSSLFCFNSWLIWIVSWGYSVRCCHFTSAKRYCDPSCLLVCVCLCLYSVSQKIPPEAMWQFFQNRWEFFDQILHAYYAFLSTLDDGFLFTYLQLWWNYAILSVTTHFTSCAQNVDHRPKCTLAFSDIFPRQLGIFSPNFIRLLNVHVYARIQIFI